MEENGGIGAAAQSVGSLDHEAAGISGSERVPLEVEVVEEQVALSGVVSGPVLGKYLVGAGVR